MDMIQITFQDFNRFFLIFIRVGVILFILPFFNSRVIPGMVKVGLTFLISLAILPVIQNQITEFPVTVTGVVQLVVGELIVGMTLGFVSQIFFEGVRLMGETVGFQTGFSITNVIDPQNGTQVSILANMAYLMAIVLFLLLNGHHVLLTALRESFEIVHVGGLKLNRQILQEIVMHAGDIFIIGIKIGAPAIAVLLFSKAIFGLITKLMPQMNIMIVGFPVQIAIGLFFFGISLRALLFFIERYIGNLDKLLIHTMQWLKV
jgi:flagellar biosynthesis protein FliR